MNPESRSHRGMAQARATQQIARAGHGAERVDRLIEHLPKAPVPRQLNRVIHARNAGAYGVFQASGRIGDVPASAFTRAGLLTQAGACTPVFVRFSTVAHGGHGPETVRDARGFSIRFQTDDGRWDLLANSLPVSVVRDATLMPSIAHAFRPEALTHRLDAQRIFDFVRFMPSALHMLLWLYSPWGIPADYRAMCGFAAGQWSNAEGALTHVRYHLLPTQGPRHLTQAEADALQARNFNHATQDLYEAVACGLAPEWSVQVQLIAHDAQASLDFDPADPTATWPVEQIARHEIGRLRLDRNPRNYFAEVEQARFDADAVVDGIVRTSGRTDAVGGDDAGRHARMPQASGESVIGPFAAATRGVRPGAAHRNAGATYRGFTHAEKAELVANLAAALSECDAPTRAHMLSHLQACDAQLGQAVTDRLMAR